MLKVSGSGSVAILQLDNPPVNALGLGLRTALMAALDELRAKAGDGLTAIVIAGSDRVFSGGADITEFGQPGAEPSLRTLIAAVESMPVPVIAAIQGVAFGGGLELAMGCDARVGWASAKLGLPEVKLGLLPGAGGTQRLPRVVGLEKAIAMILTGNPIGAAEAHAAGLLDAVLDGPYPAAAAAFAATVTRRPVRDRDEHLAPARADPGLIDRIAAPFLRANPSAAPRGCLEAIRNAVTMPFDEGLAAERQGFETLLAGSESRAQRHAFFAEREAQKPKLAAGTQPRPIHQAAVIGAGTMGGGIAMCFANAGIPVTVIETDQTALDRGMARIAELYGISIKRGSISADEAAARLGRIEAHLGLEGVGDADIVVEAVFEDIDVKRQVFTELDRLAKPGAILATNTSYLDIDTIAAATARPQDVLGMHFFSPANVMKLLEVVRGGTAGDDVVATASAIGKKLGKVSVVVGNCFGFVGNRMLARRTDAAERLLLDGASPAEVDGALVAFGFRMGPFAMADLAGLDIGMRIRRAFNKTAPVADALCAAGRFGQKTGAGYYVYTGRDAAPDPAVDAIIAAESARAGIARHPITAQEITERLVFPMINEGARILEEGVAVRPGDIDTIWLHGYNWPAWRGGPMFYGSETGLAHVAQRLTHYADQTGDETMRPSPLLARLAAQGQGFA